MRGQEFVFTLLRKAVPVHTRFFFLSFCLSIFPVPYGLMNPLQFLFSFAHMKISIREKRRSVNRVKKGYSKSFIAPDDGFFKLLQL